MGFLDFRLHFSRRQIYLYLGGKQHSKAIKYLVFLSHERE